MRVSLARHALAALLASLLLSFSFTVSAKGKGQRATPARITSLKVSTVNPDEEGPGVSGDIFADAKGKSSVFAGTGAANYPTHYLLITVEVTSDDWTAKVQLTGTEGRRVVFNKISQTNIATGRSGIENVRTYAVFFIEGDRCETIKLAARLVGQRRPSTMTKTVEFGCGE
jgi:hypothetical protein